MKPLLLAILIVFLSGCASRTKEMKNTLDKWESQTQKDELAAESGFVYVGMPKEDLEKAGYDELIQKDYRRQENEEWITYLNWTTEELDDLVTFYIVDGKVKGWRDE